MTTIEILNGLQDYLALLSAVKDHETVDQALGSSLLKKVSLSYSFITLELEQKKEDGERLYFQCKFEIHNKEIMLSSLYCEDRSKESDLRKFVEHHAPVPGFPSITNFNNYTPDVIRYFSVADNIAKPAVLCSSGDDYSPGYYSAIIVEEDKISLRQINWHNAKSSAHKDDYHMRTLEFFIPLKGQKLKSSFDSESLGEIIIHFRDSSSKQNRGCGDKIREKIEEERRIFVG